MNDLTLATKAVAANKIDHTTYYTPYELAALWKCSIDVIYDLLRGGLLKGFKVGHGWRIKTESITEYEKQGYRFEDESRTLAPKAVVTKII